MDKNWGKLANIDYLLEKLRRKKNIEFSLSLNEYCQTVLDVAQISSLKSKEPFDSMFSDRLDYDEKRFIAICLLRLLNVDDNKFQEISFRIKAFKLFDNIFKDDIYKFFKIDIKHQTYEKESKLKIAVSTSEQELSELINGFNNLKSLPLFRKTFMRAINAEYKKVILWPFVPKILLDIRLDEVFKSAEKYLNKIETNALSRYNYAKNILKEYISETNKYGTKYCQEFFGELAKKLLDIINLDFKESPLSKPAKLIVEKYEKKYPFHTPHKDIELILVIKNDGPGYAYDVEVEVEATIPILKPRHYLGQIDPRSQVELQLPCKTKKPEEIVNSEIKISCINFDGTFKENRFEIQFESQRKDIDWDKLSKEKPYDLEPVTKEDEFVGRAEILNKLSSLLTGRDSVTSAFIFGQRRVGKTSIAKILKTQLEQSHNHDFLIVYIEGGDYIHQDPKLCIKYFGETMVRKIQKTDNKYASVEIPKFEGALSPISTYLESINLLSPNLKVVFILDEFDELPMELYKRSPMGDAFFLTIRSISGKSPFGFILVGGEKMEYIISCQGDALNKFESIRVDYFDKGQHWTDFQDLVRNPVIKWLDITDGALSTLYDQTSGNPFFVKLICIDLFNIMIQRRDCHVTRREIDDAIKNALKHIESHRFQHLWEDGIIETGSKAEDKSVLRRKLLLTMAEVAREYSLPTQKYMKERCQEWGISEDEIENELREFVRRQVLIMDNNIYRCKVRFFQKWLEKKGFNEVITTIIDINGLATLKQEEQKSRIAVEEINPLVQKWAIYKGRLITEDQIRAWLNQFGDYKNQRLMFKILQNVTFFKSEDIRAYFKEANEIVKKGLIWRVKKGKRKRSDIFITYISQLEKYGNYLAKIYSDENKIYERNVIDTSQITAALEIKSKELPASVLVILDDFIGTGKSGYKYLVKLVEEHGDILRKLSQEPGEIEGTTKLKIYYIAISGFKEATAKIEGIASKLGISLKVHICSPITKAEKIFSKESEIFTSAKEKEEAKNIAYEFGVKLVEKAPHGYGDCQATIVFEHGTPKNSLTILWGQSDDFIPLFGR